jgi:selenophosphate synthase
MSIEPSLREGLVEVALDPQTSGGLLIAVAKDHAEKLVEELRAAGVTDAVALGYATSQQKAWVRLV